MIGYQHPLTRVPAVFTDRGFVIHNRSVTYQEDDVREPLIQLGPEGPPRDKTPSFFEALITGSSQSKAPKSKGAPIENFPEEPLMFDDEETEWMEEGEKGIAREQDGDAAVLRQHFTEIRQDSHSESTMDETEKEQADEAMMPTLSIEKMKYWISMERSLFCPNQARVKIASSPSSKT